MKRRLESNKDIKNIKLEAEGYDSDGGTHYDYNCLLGKGCYDKANLVSSSDKKKSKVILVPVENSMPEFEQIEAKFAFFNALYPDKPSKLIKSFDFYLLELYFVPGFAFTVLDMSQLTYQLHFFLSAIAALKNCHAKGYVVVDLKADNILYDFDTGNSYLIDGGLSSRKGEDLKSAFCWLTQEQIEDRKIRSVHIAPECWSGGVKKAQPEMDVHALGDMMQRLIIGQNQPIDAQLNNLILGCLRPLNKRIPLLRLESELLMLTSRADLINLDRFSMQVNLFLSAAKLIQQCHAHDTFLISIHPERLYYNKTTGLSKINRYSNLSSKKNHPINSTFFQCASLSEMSDRQEIYKSIAPECWSLGTTPIPTEGMDIYTLGNMMHTLLENKIIPQELENLIQNCLNPDSSLRIPLKKLITCLEALQTILKIQAEIRSIEIDFSSEITQAEINAKVQLLKVIINEKLKSPNLLSAYSQLNIIGGHHLMIIDAFNRVKDVIIKAAGDRKKEINPIHSPNPNGFFNDKDNADKPETLPTSNATTGFPKI